MRNAWAWPSIVAVVVACAFIPALTDASDPSVSSGEARALGEGGSETDAAMSDRMAACLQIAEDVRLLGIEQNQVGTDMNRAYFELTVLQSEFANLEAAEAAAAAGRGTQAAADSTYDEALAAIAARRGAQAGGQLDAVAGANSAVLDLRSYFGDTTSPSPLRLGDQAPAPVATQNPGPRHSEEYLDHVRRIRAVNDRINELQQHDAVLLQRSKDLDARHAAVCVQN